MTTVIHKLLTIENKKFIFRVGPESTPNKSNFIDDVPPSDLDVKVKGKTRIKIELASDMQQYWKFWNNLDGRYKWGKTTPICIKKPYDKFYKRPKIAKDLTWIEVTFKGRKNKSDYKYELYLQNFKNDVTGRLATVNEVQTRIIIDPTIKNDGGIGGG